MKYFTIDLDGEEINFRLTSLDCLEIEEKNKTKMLNYIMDYSHTTIITMLRYLRKSSVPNFSLKDACELMDKLIDNGYTFEKIVHDIIYEALVVSGFLSKEELEELKKDARQTAMTLISAQK